MKRGAVVLVLAAAAAASTFAQVSFTAEAAANTTRKGGYIVEEKKPLAREAEDTLRQINAYRARGATCGTRRMEPAPPLEWSEALQRAADVQARYMGGRGDITHTGADGSSVGQRAQREGYEWRTVGENVAAGRHTVPTTLAQWMDSPGHCSNIMNAAFTEVAVVGVRAGGTYGSYWAMVLGAPMR